MLAIWLPQRRIWFPIAPPPERPRGLPRPDQAAAAGSVIRLIVPVVLCPACSSTSSTVPPQLCTMSAPTTLSMRVVRAL